MKHTRGPWTARTRKHNYPDGTTHTWEVVELTDDDQHVVILGDWLTEDSARLIAAAPEMLEALKAALKLIPPPGEWDNERTKVREMIITAIYNAER